MTAFAFASARHSPGVTTSVLALAAAWPADRRLLVVEADPAGGDLICHFRLLVEPSLLSLAAAGRNEVTAEDVWEHAQQLPGGSQVAAVVAPVDPRQVAAALTTLARAGFGQVLADLDADVLIDVGRLDPDSAALELFAAAPVRVLVGRPTLNQADHLQLRAALLASHAISPLHLLVVGEGNWTPQELARSTGAASVVGALPEDPRGADAVTAQGRGVRGLRRSSLWRSARRLAAELASAAPPAMVVTADDEPSVAQRADDVDDLFGNAPGEPVSGRVWS